jgi:hypothetical protein
VIGERPMTRVTVSGASGNIGEVLWPTAA